jgi:hypothetical protein
MTDRESIPPNRQDINKGVSNYGEAQQVRDSQTTTSRPAHLTQPATLAIPPVVAPVQPVQQSNNGEGGSKDRTGNQES